MNLVLLFVSHVSLYQIQLEFLDWHAEANSADSVNPKQITIITLGIGTPYLLTILVLKVKIVHSTTS